MVAGQDVDLELIFTLSRERIVKICEIDLHSLLPNYKNVTKVSKTYDIAKDDVPFLICS